MPTHRRNNGPMSFLYEQLPLELQLREHATFENWYVGDNQALVAQIKQLLEGDERYLFIYGPPASGRSHLLQAACHHADQRQLSSVYLPLAELGTYSPEALFEGMENLSLVCLDDIQTVLGNEQWERALFNLFNALRDRDGRLLISADAPVRQLDITLPDLRSRLSWGAVFQIVGLAEEQRRDVITERARQRGLELSDEVLNFILYRCERDTESLLETLDQLDRASLREKRRLTIPFVKATLGW